MDILKLYPDEWKEYAEFAHLICFGETGYAALEKADYALLVIGGNDPLAYCTIKEMDRETLYMQWGGAFPSSKGTIASFKAYQLMIDYLLDDHKRLTTNIENTNHAMLKFAMKVGFLIQGIRVFKGSILLEHILEKGI